MKKLLKQLLAVTTAIMMAITLLPAMANAANAEVEPTSPTIDYTKKGSITINKTTGKDQNENTKPLSGAEFTVYKIASLDKTNGYQMIITAGKYTTPKSLLNLNTDEQMAAAAEFKKAIDTNAAKDDSTKVPVWSKAIPTDNGGVAKFDKLELGYYLVVETKTPNTPAEGESNGNTQYVASAPFFVAIPTSNTTSGPTDEMKDTTTTSWVYNVTAKPKNEEVGIDKKIVEKNETNKDKDTVAVGDTINYEITSTSPKYTKEYFKSGGAENDPTYNILDTLSDGLTLNELDEDGLIIDGSIIVSVNGKELKSKTTEDEKEITWYTLSPTKDEKSKKTIGFKIEFTPDFLKKEEYKGATVKVNYSVTVNENAVVGTDGNTNDVKLEYTRKPDDPATGVPGKTTPKVYTYGLVVNKIDGKEKKALSGAEFKLYKVEKVKVKNENGEEKETETETQITNLKGMTNGTYTTGEDGIVTFDGLDVGTYRLEEVKAPKNYTLLKDKIEFTIKDADPNGEIDDKSSAEVTINKDNKGQLTTTITNNKGFNLPSTGGMGTYIFTIGGLVVMAGAVLLLVSSKKKRA